MFLKNYNIVSNIFWLIISLKVLQQVTALQEINCVSVAAGQDHTVAVTDEWVWIQISFEMELSDIQKENMEH